MRRLKFLPLFYSAVIALSAGFATQLTALDDGGFAQQQQEQKRLMNSDPSASTNNGDQLNQGNQGNQVAPNQQNQYYNGGNGADAPFVVPAPSQPNVDSLSWPKQSWPP
jgi:hypothetical protein